MHEKFKNFNLASGFGYHFNVILDGLRSFANPSEACGWEILKHIPHCYVTVRPPSGGFFSSVSVETPPKLFNDHYKRVRIILLVPIGIYFCSDYCISNCYNLAFIVFVRDCRAGD